MLRAVPGSGKTETQEQRGQGGPCTRGRRRGPLPHRSHLQQKTWDPGAAASGGVCRSPACRSARPRGGAGSAPPPSCLPPPSLPFLRPRTPSSLLFSNLPPPGWWAPPAATGWEAWPPPPREGGGGSRRDGHPRLQWGTRSQAPRRPFIWTGHAGAASAPPAGAWPRRGVEEVRTSRGFAVGPLLEREGRQGGPQPLPLPLPSPPQPSRGPRGCQTGRDSGQARPEARKVLI